MADTPAPSDGTLGAAGSGRAGRSFAAPLSVGIAAIVAGIGWATLLSGWGEVWDAISKSPKSAAIVALFAAGLTSLIYSTFLQTHKSAAESQRQHCERNHTPKQSAETAAETARKRRLLRTLLNLKSNLHRLPDYIRNRGHTSPQSRTVVPIDLFDDIHADVARPAYEFVTLGKLIADGRAFLKTVEELDRKREEARRQRFTIMTPQNEDAQADALAASIEAECDRLYGVLGLAPYDDGTSTGPAAETLRLLKANKEWAASIITQVSNNQDPHRTEVSLGQPPPIPQAEGVLGVHLTGFLHAMERMTRVIIEIRPPFDRKAVLASAEELYADIERRADAIAEMISRGEG